MDVDTIEYHFDTVDSFYAELDDVLHQPYESAEDTQRIVSTYIRFLTRFSGDFLQTPLEVALAAYRLIDAAVFLAHSTTILSHILHAHALSSTAKPPELVITYSLLFHAGHEDPRWMQYIVAEAHQQKHNKLFRKLLDEMCCPSTSVLLQGAAVRLAFEMGKVARLRRADRAAITPAVLDRLLDLIEATRLDTEETFNYNIIRLILVWNEQFMIQKKQTALSTSPPNLVLDVLAHRLGTTNTLSENLIFMLNRASDDACMQLLILKLLYNIFTHPYLNESFYTNDLYVLVDISLRQVGNLGQERKAETLRDAYLRVLRPLLTHTQLRFKPYKKRDILLILHALISPPVHQTVDPSTMRLAQRILDEWTAVAGDLPHDHGAAHSPDRNSDKKQPHPEQQAAPGKDAIRPTPSTSVTCIASA